MENIIQWFQDFFDPVVVIFFILLSLYVLVKDVSNLRQEKLYREAKFFKVLSWFYILILTSFLVVNLL